MDNIGILGCGWLGLSLAINLKNKQYSVCGSRTSNQGVLELEKKGIKGFKVIINSGKSEGIKSFISNLKTLIISIPPKRNLNPHNYSKTIKKIIEALNSSKIKRIIFFSSSSVYGSKEGFYDESSSPSPETVSAKELLISEELIRKQNISSTIIRLGGLIGEDRNPIFNLIGKEIKNPKGKVNLIHKTDAISGIISILNDENLNGIFNFISPHHPTREIFYNFFSEKFNLPKPKFKNEEPLIRIIEGNKISKLTPFNYSVNNLLI